MPTGAPAYPVRPTSVVASSFFILLVSSCLCVAQDPNAESNHLLKFRNSLLANHNNIDRLSSWSPTRPPCSGDRPNWASVLCSKGRVFGLQLENMNLHGSIDVDSLVPLRSLRSLSLMNNNFDGTMPEWKKLGALKALYLSGNHFSGQIPGDAFTGMTSLKKIHLANNDLSGNIPASLEFPKLVELRLENNQFTGSIPLFSSENLKEFDVSNNHLEGPIPSHLSMMNPTAFSGNEALCGKPLDVECRGKSNMLKTIGLIVLSMVLVVAIVAIVIVFGRKTSEKERAMLAYDIEDTRTTVGEVGAFTSARSMKLRRKSSQRQTSSGATGKLTFVSEDREMFELQDLMRANAEVLGNGNLGASYMAVLAGGEALVVKRFKQMNSVAKEDFFEHMRRLGRLKHQNLLPLVAYLYRKEEKLLVFNYAENGSLAKHLHGKSKGLTWEMRLKIVKGVGKGLVYLQRELPSLTLPHGNLKASNVVLDNDFNPLLMDYALNPVVSSSNQVLVAYRSPEYVKHSLVSKKTDVWCFGLLILEMLTGKHVVHGSDQIDLIGYISEIVEEGASAQDFDKNMETSGSVSEMEKLLKIAMTCCQEDPEKRLDLEETVGQIEEVGC